MRIGALTDIGKQRKLNEDSYFVYKNAILLGGMVADGMGGQNAGEIASAMVTKSVKEYIVNEFNPAMDYMQISELVRIAFIKANEKIYNYSKTRPDCEGMGTTATLSIIYKNKIITAHVGDSRAYTIKNGEMTQLTKDHSYVQELLQRGEITKEFADRHPAKNYITRAVGADEILKVDIVITDYHGEVVLLCSDGLSNMLTNTQIIEIIEANDDLQQATSELVGLANKKGGLDNITAVAFCKE